MKQLQNHLERARREYQSLHYPDDLAAEMFAPPAKGHRWTWGAGLVAAAAVVLAVMLRPADNPAPYPRPPIGVPMFDGIALSMADLPVVSIPALPENFDFALDVPEMNMPSPGMDVGMPSFSLIHDPEIDLVSPEEVTL